MHLLNLARPALIELALSKLPRRYRRRVEEDGSSVRCLGVFRPDDAGAWYVGLRFGRSKAKPLYAQIFEIRREGAWAVVVLPRSTSFPWLRWENVLCDADAERACRRLRRFGEARKCNED